MNRILISAEIALTGRVDKLKEVERAGVFYLVDDKGLPYGSSMQPNRLIPAIIRADVERTRGFVWC